MLGVTCSSSLSISFICSFMLPISVSRGSIWRLSSLILKSSTNLNFSSWWGSKKERAVLSAISSRGLRKLGDEQVAIKLCISFLSETCLLVFFLELVYLLLLFSDGVVSILDLSFMCSDFPLQPFDFLLKIFFFLVQSTNLFLG